MTLCLRFACVGRLGARRTDPDQPRLISDQEHAYPDRRRSGSAVPLSRTSGLRSRPGGMPAGCTTLINSQAAHSHTAPARPRGGYCDVRAQGPRLPKEAGVPVGAHRPACNGTFPCSHAVPIGPHVRRHAYAICPGELPSTPHVSPIASGYQRIHCTLTVRTGTRSSSWRRRRVYFSTGFVAGAARVPCGCTLTSCGARAAPVVPSRRAGRGDGRRSPSASRLTLSLERLDARTRPRRARGARG